MSTEVELSLLGHVAVVELNGPPANYLSRDTIKALADLADEAISRHNARAIVFCSRGKHFSAGADFSTGSTAPTDEESTLYDEAARLFEIETPVVAAVQGAAVGAGLGLACSADFRVASSATRFHANFTRLGFHPGFGLSVTLERIVGQQNALDMLFSGRKVMGDEGRRMGLVDKLVPEHAVREEAITLAEELSESAPIAVRSVKRTLRGSLAAEVRAAMALELREQQRHFLTSDFAAGIAANLSRQTPTFSGT